MRILEFGTATGFLGKLLREQGHSLVGVEDDAEAAAQARPYYEQFYVADLEQFEPPRRPEFDWVLFADVLEHLRDPWTVLARSVPCLNPSGRILISVPNTAHFAVRLSLLAGRFDYRERGILDRTHLRFFTLRSLVAMVEHAGCCISGLKATPLPVQLIFPWTNTKVFAPLHHAHYALVCLRKQLFAYQFVVIARPNPSSPTAASQ